MMLYRNTHISLNKSALLAEASPQWSTWTKLRLLPVATHDGLMDHRAVTRSIPQFLIPLQSPNKQRRFINR